MILIIGWLKVLLILLHQRPVANEFSDIEPQDDDGFSAIIHSMHNEFDQYLASNLSPPPSLDSSADSEVFGKTALSSPSASLPNSLSVGYGQAPSSDEWRSVYAGGFSSPDFNFGTNEENKKIKDSDENSENGAKNALGTDSAVPMTFQSLLNQQLLSSKFSKTSKNPDFESNPSENLLPLLLPQLNADQPPSQGTSAESSEDRTDGVGTVGGPDTFSSQETAGDRGDVGRLSPAAQKLSRMITPEDLAAFQRVVQALNSMGNNPSTNNPKDPNPNFNSNSNPNTEMNLNLHTNEDRLVVSNQNPVNVNGPTNSFGQPKGQPPFWFNQWQQSGSSGNSPVSIRSHGTTEAPRAFNVEDMCLENGTCSHEDSADVYCTRPEDPSSYFQCSPAPSGRGLWVVRRCPANLLFQKNGECGTGARNPNVVRISAAEPPRVKPPSDPPPVTATTPTKYVRTTASIAVDPDFRGRLIVSKPTATNQNSMVGDWNFGAKIVTNPDDRSSNAESQSSHAAYPPALQAAMFSQLNRPLIDQNFRMPSNFPMISQEQNQIQQQPPQRQIISQPKQQPPVDFQRQSTSNPSAENPLPAWIQYINDMSGKAASNFQERPIVPRFANEMWRLPSQEGRPLSAAPLFSNLQQKPQQEILTPWSTDVLMGQQRPLKPNVLPSNQWDQNFRSVWSPSKDFGALNDLKLLGYRSPEWRAPIGRVGSIGSRFG